MNKLKRPMSSASGISGNKPFQDSRIPLELCVGIAVRAPLRRAAKVVFFL